MSTPLYGQISGTYVSDGAARVLQLRFDPDYFALFNQTNFNEGEITPITKRAWWFRSLDPDSAFTVKNTISADTDESDFVTSGGIRLINTITDVLEPAVAGTTITAAAPPVVTTSAAHGYAIGDVVRIFSTTAMLQIAGMDFTITDVPTTTTFEIGFLDASGFAAGATANVSRRLPFDPPDFAPKNRFITNITQAVNAVVTLSVDHGYNVNEIISLRCTPAFGMSEVDGVQGQILSIDTALNTVTLDLNTTSFTAFAFPTSTIAGAGITFPQTIPVGDFDVLTGAIDNQAFIGLRLGLDVVGVADDVVHWVATKGLFGIA
ncbi:hypothetical protein LCGC14_1588670 [marine sediment metagenome]|uniref:Ubiquitin-activating enzyme E1 FCCH domain-containing protein n=1 Tax=marine sediment metagenome TaxID=412755 RepID=A0A0F9IEP9_9ZZZZ